MTGLLLNSKYSPEVQGSTFLISLSAVLLPDNIPHLFFGKQPPIFFGGNHHTQVSVQVVNLKLNCNPKLQEQDSIQPGPTNAPQDVC